MGRGGGGMTPAARDGRLGAILVNHNFYPMVMETLRMLQEATRRYDDLVVVDNSSGGEFWRLIREELGAAATVVHVENHGYAAAVNTGVRVLAGLGYGPGDYVVVTTHETKPRQDAVGRLVEALEDDLRIGVAGPTLLDGNRSGARIWSEGGRLSRFLGLPEHVNWADRSQGVRPSRRWTGIGLTAPSPRTGGKHSPTYRFPMCTSCILRRPSVIRGFAKQDGVSSGHLKPLSSKRARAYQDTSWVGMCTSSSGA